MNRIRECNRKIVSAILICRKCIETGVLILWQFSNLSNVNKPHSIENQKCWKNNMKTVFPTHFIVGKKVREVYEPEKA